MSEDVKQFFADYKQDMGKVRRRNPATVDAFGALFAKIMPDGALPLKYKELVAIGIAVGEHCPPCISLHVQKALDAGCSPDEIMEAASVAVVMAGGPGYTHLALVERALEACTPK
jgi:AhpD family alkylhydroperoxidase